MLTRREEKLLFRDPGESAAAAGRQAAPSLGSRPRGEDYLVLLLSPVCQVPF